jgi:nitrate/nitrite transporter NarK
MNFNVGPRNIFIVLAVVLFLVGLVLLFADDTPDAKTQQVLMFGGLASFAAGFLFP